MNFVIAADTDIGIVKNTNQDSLSIKLINTRQGRMAFAVLCDGMGGLDKGEVASATLIKAFDNWVKENLLSLCNDEFQDDVIKHEWENIVYKQNEILHKYGKSQGVVLGTTLVVMLITEKRYYLMNIGDSRAYEITDEIKQLTKDQTFVAREVELGNMTSEQAENDPRKNVLLQCIGASDAVFPDMFYGETKAGAMYILCSDGFRHEISSDEILNGLNPGNNMEFNAMKNSARQLIELNKQRAERDNISVAMIRTF